MIYDKPIAIGLRKLLVVEREIVCRIGCLALIGDLQVNMRALENLIERRIGYGADHVALSDLVACLDVDFSGKGAIGGLEVCHCA